MPKSMTQDDRSMTLALPQDITLVDAWLRREFQACYDNALEEPIPPELAILLRGSLDGR